MKPLKPVYVETFIAAEMDELWEATQDPKRHEQWDLRFSSITYLPKAHPEDPQTFRYATRIGFGLEIEGTGKNSQNAVSADSRTSTLEFGSDQPLSLIRKGSGYWKYEQQEDGIVFKTLYQYQTRFGQGGRWLDRIMFRPLIGWATAWSFDCLKLWLERGVHPRDSAARYLTHWLCVAALAFIWIYQGVVPKLWLRDPQELQMLAASGMFAGKESLALLFIGTAEAIWGIALLLLHRLRAVYWLQLAMLAALLLAAGWTRTESLGEAFNPVTLNVAMAGLAAAALLTTKRLVQPGRCLRRPRKAETP